MPVPSGFSMWVLPVNSRLSTLRDGTASFCCLPLCLPLVNDYLPLSTLFLLITCTFSKGCFTVWYDMLAFCTHNIAVNSKCKKKWLNPETSIFQSTLSIYLELTPMMCTLCSLLKNTKLFVSSFSNKFIVFCDTLRTPWIWTLCNIVVCETMLILLELPSLCMAFM